MASTVGCVSVGCSETVCCWFKRPGPVPSSTMWNARFCQNTLLRKRGFENVLQPANPFGHVNVKAPSDEIMFGVLLLVMIPSGNGTDCITLLLMQLVSMFE